MDSRCESVACRSNRCNSTCMLSYSAQRICPKGYALRLTFLMKALPGEFE